MMFELDNTLFLKPSELIHDLLILQQIKSGELAGGQALPNHRLSRQDIAGCLHRLEAGGFIHPNRGIGAEAKLTNDGEQQMRMLLVDYIRELMLLHNEVIAVFRKKLAQYYMADIRKVAFYPVSDTAEVVYAALAGSGLTLVAAVDDDPSLWGSPFHELLVQAPSTLSSLEVDGVICTTAVFEEQIRARLALLAGVNAKFLTLW